MSLVEFRDVALAYEEQSGFAVEDISLSIAPGKLRLLQEAVS